MATHSSVLAWRISRTEEPGGLQGGTRLKQLGLHTRAIFGRGEKKTTNKLPGKACRQGPAYATQRNTPAGEGRPPSPSCTP